MPSFARLALVTALVASLPLVGVVARDGQGGRGDGASHGGVSARGADRATSGRATDRAEHDRAMAGRPRAAHDAPAEAAVGRGRVSATATTAAFAGRHRAAAQAGAAAVARGPRTMTRTVVETSSVVRGRFRAAVAVAEAVARSFFGGVARRPDKPLAGVPAPAAFVGKAIASATGEAVARGPHTLTETFTDTFARVGPSSATAVAISASVALSARGRPGLTAAGTELGRKARADDRGEGAPAGSVGDGLHRQATGSGVSRGEGGAGRAPCGLCRVDEPAALPALY